MPSARQLKKIRRSRVRRLFFRSHKRFVRVGLLAANLILLIMVVGFVVKAPASRFTHLSASDNADVASGPIDQLSSADIAVNVARIASLEEAVSITNHADSVDAQVNSNTVNETVIAKPLLIGVALPSRLDIRSYITKSGDTVASIAQKFGVSSNSVRWSNGLTGDLLLPGKTLYLPPAGQNGIVYTVQSGDTPSSLAQKYNADKELIITFNDAEVGGLRPGEQIFIPNGSLPVPVFSYNAFASTAKYGFNGYDYGFCTWYVANRRQQIGRPVPANLGDAYSWLYIAQAQGLPTGSEPRVGAVAVNTAGDHVSVVEVVKADGSFWVSEMNSSGQVSINDPTPAGGWNHIDYKFYNSVGSLRFIY